MKLNRIVYIFLGLALSHQSAAGVGSSGGGMAVVCRSLSGQIKEAALLDIYEASAGGFKMKKASGQVADDLKLLYAEFRKSTFDRRPIRNEHLEMLNSFLEQTKFVSYRLPSTDDVGRIPQRPPANCKIEQLAVADDQYLNFYVDREIWNALDSLNQAALIFHESIYQMARVSGIENTSWRTRAIVGTASSQQGLDNMYEGANPGEAVICRATSSTVGTNTSYALIYPDPEDSRMSVLVFTRYFDFIPFHRLPFRIPKLSLGNLETVANQQTKTALIVNDPNAQVSGKMHKGYKILDEERFAIEYSHGRLFTLTKLTEKNQPLITANFTDCRIWNGH